MHRKQTPALRRQPIRQARMNDGGISGLDRETEHGKTRLCICETTVLERLAR